MENKMLLMCLLCGGHFSLLDVHEGAYYETGICKACYEEKKKDKQDCFAKKFNPEHIECKKFCADRRICRKFVLSRNNPK